LEGEVLLNFDLPLAGGVELEEELDSLGETAREEVDFGLGLTVDPEADALAEGTVVFEVLIFFLSSLRLSADLVRLACFFFSPGRRLASR
jgi:hypothetical protein